MAWVQAQMTSELAGYITPEQRQRFLAYYCAHPNQMPLYCLLNAMDAGVGPEAAALLSRGLRAVLHLMGRSSAQRPPAGPLRDMLHVTIAVLSSECWYPLFQQVMQQAGDNSISATAARSRWRSRW